MEKPSSIATRRVAVQYVIGAVDGPDADDEPDFIPARGVVEFTASVAYTPWPEVSGPNPMTVLNAKITGVLDDEGYLCTPHPSNPTLPGKRGVRLLCTDGSGGSVKEWTWTAAPKFVDANGTRIPDVIPPFSFYLPSDPDPNAPDLDLTTVVKVPASQGTGTAQAEALAALASAAAASSANSAETAVAAVQAATATIAEIGANIDAAADRSIERANIPAKVTEALGADDTVAKAATVAVGKAITGLDILSASDPRVPQIIPKEPEWAHVSVDDDGNVIDGIKPDGTHYIRSLSSPGVLSSEDDRIPQRLADISTWQHVEADSEGNIVSGIKTDGTYYFRSLESPKLSALPAKVAVFGDSMAGDHGGLGVSIASVLADTLGVEVFKGGVPGQTSTEISLRQGGLDVFLTVDGGNIPASGAVPVTVAQPAGTWKTGSTWTFQGSLAGIPGALEKSATDTWTFTRTSAGTATPVKPEARWVSTDGRTRADWVQVWRGGRNNVDAATVARDERAMRAGLAGNNSRFLVLPTYNMTSEPLGSAGYVRVMAINATRAEVWGPNFYDLRGWLIRNGLREAGITPTPEDQAAISEDRIPPSLMFDGTHLNAIGRTIEGRRIAHIITSKGWL